MASEKRTAKRKNLANLKTVINENNNQLNSQLTTQTKRLMKTRTIKTKLHGKEEMFKVIALGEATGLPVLFVGPPGVAKTNVLLDYAANMHDSADDVRKHTFIIELDEATKNTEIKGRPDMKELLENKRYLIDAPI